MRLKALCIPAGTIFFKELQLTHPSSEFPAVSQTALRWSKRYLKRLPER
jgi:hypothetical protein